MGVKIGLTGHTADFGPFIKDAIFDYCKWTNEYGPTGEECIVVGFSRSTGYDITNRDHVEAMFDDEKDLDVIINNAENEDGQMNVAEAAYKRRLPCLNIGSLITEVDVSELASHHAETKNEKVKLKQFSNIHKQEYITFGFVPPHPYVDINPAVAEENMTPEKAAEKVVDKLHDMGIL